MPALPQQPADPLSGLASKIIWRGMLVMAVEAEGRGRPELLDALVEMLDSAPLKPETKDALLATGVEYLRFKGGGRFC